MTDTEAISVVRAGGRCVTTTTQTNFPLDENECVHSRGWRTVACDDVTDVIECPMCGKQRLAKCNFEDECS